MSEDFKPGMDAYEDESKLGQGHITPTDDSRTVQVPAGDAQGTWVDVPKGMVAAPGTYVDEKGVLRSSGDNSCVVWHNKGCPIKGLQPEDIIYTVNGAPWCPKCYLDREMAHEKERIANMFKAKAKTN